MRRWLVGDQHGEDASDDRVGRTGTGAHVPDAGSWRTFAGQVHARTPEPSRVCNEGPRRDRSVVSRPSGAQSSAASNQRDPTVARTPQSLLPELHESAATGRIAEIYAEIRMFSGVAYVSSLQRYLATLPGVLDWAWTALRPAMVSGVIPETGWRLAREIRLPPARTVPPDALRRWGVDNEALTAIRNIAANFVRVSPVNLVIGACLRCVLNGPAPSGAGYAQRWTPPAPLPPMPGNVDPAALPDSERGVLLRFATDLNGTPFVPALYRQLAHWPPVLAWLADQLVPRLGAPETAAMRAAFQSAARTVAPGIAASLPGLPSGVPPDAETTRRVLAAITRYADTSPEMTAFGQLILDALPSNHS
jgi:hypothetical protein